MNIVKLSESLGVTGQITPEDVAAIAAAGYDVIINNRPDGEVADQPDNAAIAAAAEAAGIAYYYLPVNAQDFPGRGFDQMRELLGDPGQRVLAFCRTGTRCTNLWVVSRDEADRAASMEVSRQQGFELSLAARYLENHQ